jgi:hypothetical protein
MGITGESIIEMPSVTEIWFTTECPSPSHSTQSSHQFANKLEFQQKNKLYFTLQHLQSSYTYKYTVHTYIINI